jgi:hypothetical protein
LRVTAYLAAMVLVAALGGAVPVAAAGAGATVHCTPPGNGQGPRNDASLPIGLLSVQHMSCHAARSAIRAGTFIIHGGCFGPTRPEPCRTYFRTPGFRCRAPHLGNFHCTDRARRFDFAWGE